MMYITRQKVKLLSATKMILTVGDQEWSVPGAFACIFLVQRSVQQKLPKMTYKKAG